MLDNGENYKSMMGLSLLTGTGGRNLKLDYIYIEDVVNVFMAVPAKLKNQETAEAEYSQRSGSAHTLREVVDTFDQVYGTSLHVEWGAYPYRPKEIFSIPRSPLPGCDRA